VHSGGETGGGSGARAGDVGSFNIRPDPANPGWFLWNIPGDTGFNAHALGHLIARPEGASGARLRMSTDQRHANPHGSVHGGVTMAFIDISIFAAAAIVLRSPMAGTVTLDLNTQFIGAGAVGEPLEVAVEVLKNTRRLVFLRGVVEQGDHLVAAFSGTLRKPSSPPVAPSAPLA